MASTQDAAQTGDAIIVPHVAVTDLNFSSPAPERDIFIYFRGGCSQAMPAGKEFASGKIQRLAFVNAMKKVNASDIMVSGVNPTILLSMRSSLPRPSQAVPYKSGLP